MHESPSKLVPALIGGGVIALLSSIPIVNMGNCLCCMWVMLGGGVGAYSYWKKLSPEVEFSSGDGAILGLLSGLFGALFGAFLSYFFLVVVGFNMDQGIFKGILENMDNMPPEVDDIISEWEDTNIMSPVIAIMGLFSSLITNSIFGTIGGIITASILRKKRTE